MPWPAVGANHKAFGACDLELLWSLEIVIWSFWAHDKIPLDGRFRRFLSP
jgi:hypothetical protein